MVILKHGIARICSLKTNSELLKTKNIYTEKLNFTLNSICNLEDNKIELLNKLHSYNSKIEDVKILNAIQNIRRSIHNSRAIKNKDVSALKINGETSVLNLLENYLSNENNNKNSIDGFYSYFLDEWIDKRNELHEISKSNPIHNGLLLSSNSLIDALNKKQSNNKTPNKKEKQIEIGLLKYVTRSLFKPTPFSSFTQLNHVKIEESIQNYFCKTDNEKDISYIRINNAIFQRIRSYMTKIQPICLHLEVNLNPSISFNKDSNQYKILINKNNLEFFQTIEKNSIVELISDFLSINKSVLFIDLINHCKKSIDAEEEDIIKYALRLANIGLFEFNYKASGTDIDWIDKLNKSLNLIPASDGRDLLIKLLNDLELSRSSYESNFYNLEERKKVLETVSNNLNNHLASLSKTVNPDITEEKLNNIQFKKEKIFLEDTLSKKEISIGSEFIKPFFSKIDLLIDYCSEYSPLLNKEKELFSFYINEYNSDEIPLLKFYEDYFRRLKANKEDKKDIEFKNIPQINYFSETVFDIINNQEEEINFCFKKDIKQVKKVKHSYSSSMFFQLSNLNGNQSIIVNGTGWGYGRMSSRFLYLFDSKFTEDIKTHNKALTENIIYSEINDASFFNANLHPPLFTHECIIPGGHKNLNEDFQLKVNELIVKKDANNKKLLLIDSKTGKQVFIHDSCFQGEKGRSQLFNLLLIFSDKVTPVYRFLLTDLNRKQQLKINQNTTLFPRIIFENNIVLQRKYWIVNNLEFPVMLTEEKEYDYYLRILFWFRKLKIPSKVFITLNYSRNKDKTFSPDDYKPQYIDIENPLFLPLIIKLFKKTESLKIMEMLPTAEDAIDFNDDKHTAEFLIQWYNGESYE